LIGLKEFGRVPKHIDVYCDEYFDPNRSYEGPPIDIPADFFPYPRTFSLNYGNKGEINRIFTETCKDQISCTLEVSELMD
jgi:hypothetical protein